MGKESYKSKVVGIFLGQVPNNRSCLSEVIRGCNFVIDLVRPDNLWFVFRNDNLKACCNNTCCYIPAEEYAIEQFEEVRAEYLRWISSTPNAKLFNGKSLKESFVYDDNISLWWLTCASQKQFNKTPLGTYFHQISAIESVIKKYKAIFTEKCKDITFVLFGDSNTEYNLFSYEIEELSREIFGPELPIHFKQGSFFFEVMNLSTATSVLKRFYSKLKKSHLAKSLYHAFNLVKACSAIKRNKNGNSSRKTDILINTDFPKDWQNKIKQDLESIQDHYLADIFYYLDSKKLSVAWLPILSTPAEVKLWFSQTNPPEAIHLQLRPVQIVKTYFKILGHLLKWQYKFRLLKKNLKSQFLSKGLSGREFHLIQCLLDDISMQIKGGCVPLLLKYELIKQGLLQEVKCIFLRKEFHTSSRFIKAALKSTKTQVVGVQHGMAREVYYQYYLSNDETGLAFNSKELQQDYINYMPVPDYDLLFGDHTKNMLLSHGGYPSERLLVTGVTRLDAAVKKMQEISLLEICQIKQQAGLPLDRKIVAFCPALPRYIKDISEMTMKAIKSAKSDPFLIIKLHPHFGGKESILKAAVKTGFTEFIIIDMHIGDLILVSDIVCSQISTVCYEAVLLGKPHILLAKDLAFRKDKVFSEEPCITPVFDAQQMSKIIDELLMNENFHESFIQKRPLFLKKYMNNIDGNALERVETFVKQYT